jgi:hypothetical protein
MKPGFWFGLFVILTVAVVLICWLRAVDTL